MSFVAESGTSPYDPALALATATSTVLPPTLTLGHGAAPGGYLAVTPSNFGNDALFFYLDGT